MKSVGKGFGEPSASGESAPRLSLHLTYSETRYVARLLLLYVKTELYCFEMFNAVLDEESTNMLQTNFMARLCVNKT